MLIVSNPSVGDKWHLMDYCQCECPRLVFGLERGIEGFSGRMDVSCPPQKGYFPVGCQKHNRMIQFSFFLLYRYKVVLLMPVVSSICEIEQTLESYMLNARSILDLSFGGRPPLRPLARAACKPSIVLCRIKSRSN